MRKSNPKFWTDSLLKHLKPHEINYLRNDWRFWARLDQLPPEGAEWRQWLILGGRGAGKTRAGAEWVKAVALGLWLPYGRQAKRIALLAPTFAEARLVMIEGESGLLAIHDEVNRPKFEPSKRILTWPNGVVAQIFTAEEPDGLRGPQFDAAWCDELAKWKNDQDAWDMLKFALRLGDHPVAVITTTPRTTLLVKKIMQDPATVITRATTFDNKTNLAPSFLKEMQERYQGTRLGRQELEGELIEDDPEALFSRVILESYRVEKVPQLKRIVVAVDPPASFGTHSNACGIICAGLGEDERCYVLNDATVQGLRPAQWAQQAITLYHTQEADRIIAEVNQGGAMVEQILREIDSNISFRAVHASRSKYARAEPVAALYEQGRISHVGAFPALEDEMCSRIGTGKASPDRLDALVWAITDLLLRKKTEPRVRIL